MAISEANDRAEAAPTLARLAGHMLLLGCTAFGGPAAHIAMMRREFVQRRGYLTDAEFLGMLGVVNLLPGPNSSEMAMHIGHKFHGLRGLWLCGLAFIMPAVLLMTGMSALFVHASAGAAGLWANMQGALAVLRPVTCALVVSITVQLLLTAEMRRSAALFGAAFTALLLFTGLGEVAVLLAAGGAVAVMRALNVLPLRNDERGDGAQREWGRAVMIAGGVGAVIGLVTMAEFLLRGPAMSGATPATLLQYFLRIGSVLYGSGYVLVSYIEFDFVTRFSWMTREQLLNAVAVGQALPGPLFATAAFLGYQLAGLSGAAAAAVGIFAPAFFAVAFAGRLAEWLRRAPATAAFLHAVQASSLVLLALVAYKLGRAALVGPVPVTIFLMSAPLFFARINSAWVMVAAALVGAIFFRT